MRKDGYKLKGTNKMYTVAAHLMSERSDAMNMVTIDIPVDSMHNFLNKKKKEGISISHLALIISAYIRTVSEFPELNRFVVNRRYYAHKDFAVAMVVLKSGDRSHGIMSKCFFDLSDTVYDVNNKINNYIEKNRQSSSNNSTEKVINAFLSIPGLLRLGVPFVKFLDNIGLLPKAIIDASPFHNSLAISNLASIKTNHIYHHCYNFGTTSVFITLGNKRQVPKEVNGEVKLETCIPMGIVMDERICSGGYFALAFRKFEKYLKNPEILESKPDKITPDPNIPQKQQ